MNNITKKIALEDTGRFDAGDFSGQVYVPDEAGAGFDALLVTINGRHPKKKMVNATRNYFNY